MPVIETDDATKYTDALYYPYIHIGSDEWLKATLLYFPHVLRMVPAEMATHDSEFVSSAATQRGTRNEPLLGSYRVLQSYGAYDAVDRLTFRLTKDIESDPSFLKRFSEASARAAYGKDNQFLINRGKAPQHFWSRLLELGLMWPGEPLLDHSPSMIAEPDMNRWAAVHPVLGEAFMATIAAAAANELGLDIVTELPDVHSIVASRDEEAIYSTLIHGKQFRSTPQEHLTFRLAHLVIIGGFDLSEMSAVDLAKMSRNGETLYEFRSALAQRISRIRSPESDQRHLTLLKEAAEEILVQWRNSLATMSRFAKRFFGAGLLEKSEKSMIELAKAVIPASLSAGAATGAAALLTTPFIAAAPGLAIGLAVYGISTWKSLRQAESTGPLRYLSLLRNQGAALLAAAPPNIEDDPRFR